jgi:hypothetical protein
VVERKNALMAETVRGGRMLSSFDSINDAARPLLGETTLILDRFGTDYVVVGGWSVCLLNDPDLIHPGTADVDVLFQNAATKGTIEGVVEVFLKGEYLLSAKHPFQLLRKIRVCGREFFFNVDLCHPLETQVTDDRYDLMESAVPTRRLGFWSVR